METRGNANAKQVLLLLGPGFEDAEAAVALSACRWTQYRAHLTPIQVTVTGLSNAIEGRFGTIIPRDLPLDAVDPVAFDAVIIPGGFRDHGFEDVYREDVLGLVRRAHEAGAWVATMCVGALVAARACILEGAQATTYEFSRHSNYAILEECGCHSVHKPVCVSNRVISCSGPAYTEDVMDELLRQLLGQEAAELQTFRRGISPER